MVDCGSTLLTVPMFLHPQYVGFQNRRQHDPETHGHVEVEIITDLCFGAKVTCSACGSAQCAVTLDRRVAARQNVRLTTTIAACLRMDIVSFPF